MTSVDRAGQRTVRTYAVLCGLTPLVPLPFIDDLVRGYFRRRLVRELGIARGRALSSTQVYALTDEPGRGFLLGCLIQPLVYVLKKIFRKIFFFLEWKRAVDTASENYHFGSLVDYAFQEGWLGAEGSIDPARLRTAIDAVLARQGTNPIESAFKETFSRSKNTLLHAAGALRKALRGVRKGSADEQVAQAVESVEPEGRRSLDGVTGDLQDALAKVPPVYLDHLCRLLANELEATTAAAGVPP